MSKHIGLGISIIAVCYAFARFSFGLLLPDIQQDFHWQGTESGMAQSVSYFTYALALLLAPWLLVRISLKMALIITMQCAAIGMAIMAIATSTTMLVAGIAIAGISTGLSSPLAGQLTESYIDKGIRQSANAWINSGTSFGIISVGIIYVLLLGHWRGMYLLLTLLSLVVTVGMLRMLPNSHNISSTSCLPSQRLSLHRGNLLLCAASLLIGMGSSVYWTYAVTHLQTQQHLSSSVSTLYWIIMGASGIVGGLAGRWIGKYGLTKAFAGATLLLVSSILLLVCSQPWISLLSVVGFGSSYIFLSGLLIIWGTILQPKQAAAQISLAFFMLGLGQFVGSWLAGWAVSIIGLNGALASFAGIALLSLLCRPNLVKEQ